MHTRFVSLLTPILLLAGATTLVSAQVVELLPSTSPSSAQGGLTEATITATRGVPATATAAQLAVRIRPRRAGMPTVSVPVTSIQTIGGRRTIRFAVPAQLALPAVGGEVRAAMPAPGPAPALADVEVVDTRSPGGPQVITAAPALMALAPPPSLSSVWPPSADRGSTLDVRITGLYTTFPANASSMTLNFGSGITATPKLCSTGASPTAVCATLSIAAGASSGPRNVSLSYGGVTINLANGFVVTSSGPKVLSLLGNGTIVQGETREVTFKLSGAVLSSSTQFVWNFGDQLYGPADGLAVTVSGDTATLRLLADRNAIAGLRNAMLLVNGDLYSAAGLLRIVQAPSVISQVFPSTFVQGKSESVNIYGQGTAFLQNLTSVSFGPGVTVGSVEVLDSERAVAQVAVASNATPGPRTVTVTTLGDVPTAGSARVVAGSPNICSTAPAYAIQGTSTTLSLGFCFVTPVSPITVSIPDGVTTGTPVIAGTVVSVPVTVSAIAPIGARTGVVTFGGKNYNFAFSVIPSSATLVSVCREPGCLAPAKAVSDDSITLRVKGSNTNFIQGTTSVALQVGSNNLAATRVLAIGGQELLADFQLTGVPAGVYRLYATTGGETPSFDNALEVASAPPVFSISPPSGKQGASVPVSFNVTNGGTLPSTCPALSVAGSSGTPAGIVCQNYVLSSPSQATATYLIDKYAVLGNRLATVSGSTGFFSVTPSDALLVSISKTGGTPGETFDVTLTGQNTNWCQGSVATCPSPSTLNFGGFPVSIFTVNSPTQATARVSIPLNAAIGVYTVAVTTGGEFVSLPNWFAVTAMPVVPPSISSVTPTSVPQGQTATIDIAYANLAQAITGSTPITANFGPGITTVSATALTANSIRAVISADPLTVIGPRTLATTINGVAIAGNFSVTRGPAAIQSMTPSAARQGQSNVQVTLTGNNGTHFTQGTTVADFGPGITVNALAVTSANSARASITLAYAAALGSRTVRLTTGGELADSVGVFTVNERLPLVLSATPSRARQGETVDVTVLGEATSWNGSTVADFGAGVTATLLSAPALERAIVRVTVSPTAAFDTGLPCARSVRMTTGTEIATLLNGFCVDPGPAVISSVSPNSATQGENKTITINGTATSFQQGVSTVSLGAGITVGTINVSSPTSLTAQIAVAPGAATGLRSVTVTTLGEVASGANLFTVGAATPILTQAAPNSLGQGAGPTEVTLTGQFTSWQQGVSTVTFGAGVTVDSVTVDSATQARATVRVDPLAFTGGRTVTVTTGGQIVSAPVFSVATGPAAISTVVPSSANQGDNNVQVVITGTQTHFQAGLTTVGLSLISPPTSLTPVSVVVTSPTSLTATFNIPAQQAPAAYDLSVATSGEALIRTGGFTINAATPQITNVSPSSAPAGTNSVAVILTGVYTQWAQGSTTVSFGAGITVDNVVVNNPTSITATISLSAGATVGPRSVTVTTGAQVLTSNFNVTPQVVLLSMTPNVILRGQTANLVVTGQNTQWVQGTTAASFSAAGVTVNSTTVNSNTQITVNVTVDSAAAIGDRTLTVTTGAQVLTGLALNISPGLSSVSPSSGARGQTLTVTVNGGPLTKFTQGQSQPNFGPGVTVNTVQVLALNQLTANISIDAAAALSTRDVVVTTGTEVASGPGPADAANFTVTGAPAFSLDPASLIQGQQNVTVNINPQFLTLSAGNTFINFGSGITSNEIPVNVTSSTTGSVVVSVSPTATTGLRTATLRVGSNSYTTQVNVTPSTAKLLSAAPSSAKQGDTVDVVVTGQNTNFAAGQTTASFGTGVTATILGIDSPTQARVRLVIDALASVGSRNPVLTTGGESASGTGLFTVDAGTPTLLSITPNSGKQQESISATILGRYTSFDTASTPTLGAGVTVNSFTVNSPTSITANLTIQPRATLGLRNLNVSGVANPLNNAFTVTAGPAAISSLSPATLQQNRSGAITITGANTNFASGLTTASFGAGITVNSLTINSGTSAVAQITVAPDAAVGPRTVTLTTEGETASIANGFNVTLGAGSIDSVSPATLQQGTAGTTVTVSGYFPGYVGQTVTASFSGSDVTASVTNVTLTQITLSVNVNGWADRTSRNLTLTNGIDPVIRNNAITITTGNAAISSLTPSSAKQGATVDVVVTGSATSFGLAPSATTASLGDLTVLSVTPSSATQATVKVQISEGATTGPRTLTMTSGAEVVTLANGFTVQPGDPVILSATPSSALQGATVASFVITGKFTHFSNASVVDLGSGITASVVSATATQLNASLTIDATASTGARTLTVTSGGEVVTLANAFTVNPGVAVLTSLNTSAPPKQGAAVVFTINGNFTNFSAAAPPAVNLGAGVTTGTVTVVNPNQVTVNGTVSGTAALGARTVTVNPGSLTLVNAFTVVAGDATISTSPSSARQGDTNVSITITGVGTNFSQGTTTASLSGAGVTTGALVVNSATSATLPVTSISDTAATGIRTLTLTTGGEVVTANFDVQPGIPVISSITPASAAQGTSPTVTIVGRFTSFTAGSTVSLGSGITAVVNSATATNIQATLTIAATASKTARTLTVDALSLANAFTVTASPAVLSTVSPALGAQGATLNVQIAGTQTNFQQGVTTASFGAGITVNSVTVSSATQAAVNITIAANAATGPRSPVLTTGGEEATLSNAFVVSVGLPEITGITPAFGAAGTTVSNIQVTGVNLTGATFTIGGTETIPSNVLGSAILVGGNVVSVTNLTATSATLQIQFGAVTGIYPLVATTPAGASTTVVTPSNQILVYQGTGYLTARATTILNGTITPLDPVPPALKYVTARATTVINGTTTPLDPIPPALKYVTARAVTVINGSTTPLDPTPPSLKYVTSRATTVRNQSSPVLVPASSVSSAETSAAAAAAASKEKSTNDGEVAYAGQALRIQVAVPEGVRVDGVNVYVNGAKLEDPLRAPYETVITVPSGVAELEIRSVVLTESGEVVAPLRRVRVARDEGRQVAFRVLDPEDREVTDANVSVRYFGLTAEHFRFDQPLAGMPEIAVDRKPDATGFAALLHYLPQGQDPLGTGASRDTVSRYRGALQVVEGGEYEFRLRGSAGAVLRINDKAYAEGSRVVLEPGALAQLEILHYRTVEASASLHLEWRMAGAEREFETIRPEYLRTAPVADKGQLVPQAVTQFEVRAESSGAGAGQVVSASPAERIVIIRVAPQAAEQSRGKSSSFTHQRQEQR